MDLRFSSFKGRVCYWALNPNHLDDKRVREYNFKSVSQSALFNRNEGHV